MNELNIKGIGIARDVVATIVTMAVKQVDGVAQVGQDVITSSLISVFSPQSASHDAAVESEAVDDKLVITVHVAVFFGYQFTEVADAIRNAVVHAVAEHIGVEVASVDVCIDSLVFPKE